jgi:AcrR family transcriptional regulator
MSGTSVGGHRRRQAERTRELILESARAAFLEAGYGAATIEDVACRAGVGVSTVYAVLGSKRGILAALGEAWGWDKGRRELLHEALGEEDLTTRLETAAHATRREWEAGAQAMAVLESAAAADREVVRSLETARAGRERAYAPLVASLGPRLRAGLDPAAAFAIFAALTRADLYRELVGRHGWTPDRYEAWLAATLVQQLLG